MKKSVILTSFFGVHNLVKKSVTHKLGHRGKKGEKNGLFFSLQNLVKKSVTHKLGHRGELGNFNGFFRPLKPQRLKRKSFLTEAVKAFKHCISGKTTINISQRTNQVNAGQKRGIRLRVSGAP